MKNFLRRLFKKPEHIKYAERLAFCMTPCPNGRTCSVNSLSCTKCDKYCGSDAKKQIVYCSGGIK